MIVMVKSIVKILRAFYREQDKEVDRKVDPDVDTQTPGNIERTQSCRAYCQTLQTKFYDDRRRRYYKS